MKTRVFTLLLLCTIPFVSCQKDNPTGQGGLLAVDDVSSFIGRFVSLDKDGQVALQLSGHLLNEADPTEISYCADTWKEALKMTKSWLPENAKYQETETSLTWEMHDADGASLGNLVLSQKTGGLVAEAVLPAGIPYVHTIRFIPRMSWPQNATELDTDELLDEYFYGNVVNVTKAPAGHDHGTGEFIVIREFDELKNEKGIMFRIPNKTYKTEQSILTYKQREELEAMKKRSRSLDDAVIVDKLYRADKDFLATVVKSTNDFALKPLLSFDSEATVNVFIYGGYLSSFGILKPSTSSSNKESIFCFPDGNYIPINSVNFGNYNLIYELDIYYFWVELNGSKTVLKIE